MSTRLAFLCHPVHRGGVTRWMAAAATEWSRSGREAWFVTVRPPMSEDRPHVTALLEESAVARPTVVAPEVGRRFQLGTMRHQAHVYATAILRSIPAGVPVVVSDATAVWQAGAWLAGRHPLIGVLHADDRHYYELCVRHRRELSGVVSVSRRIANRARGLVDRAVRAATITCGIPLPPAQRDPSGPSQRIRMIWVGRVEQLQKRVLDLPRILHEVRRAGLDATLDIVGDGPDSNRLSETLETLQVSRFARVHGWLPPAEVQAKLRQSDVLLLPSNFEGMPLVVMEALGAGCGVVASCVSGIEDLAAGPRARDCVRVHPVGDIAATVAAIKALTDLARRKVAASARALAESEFSIRTCMDRYAELIAELEGTRRRSPPGWRISAWTASVLSQPVAAARELRRWMNAG